MTSSREKGPICPFLYEGDRPKGRSKEYQYGRIAERFPGRFRGPEDVKMLEQTDPKEFGWFIGYEVVREGEEAQVQSLRVF